MSKMAIYNGAAFSNAAGVAVAPLALITVRRMDSLALATLFSDVDGLSPLANPFPADSLGRFAFYTAGIPRGYRVRMDTVTSPTESYTVDNQAIGTAAELDASAFAATLLDDSTAAEARTTLGAQQSLDALALESVIDPSDFLPLVGVGSPEETRRVLVSAFMKAVSSLAVLDSSSLSASIANNVLTVSVLAHSEGVSPQDDTPSSRNPAKAQIRSVTSASGELTRAEISGALTLAINDGSTMGVASAVPFRLWVAVFNDNGVYRLALRNCVATVAGAGGRRDVTAIYPLPAWGIGSAVAEGGSPGDADSAGVWYANATITSKPFAVLGYLEWGDVGGSPTEFGLVSAGRWARLPTRIQPLLKDTPLPGQVVQTVRTDTGAVATGAALIPSDDSIPQSNEGDQYMLISATPISPANPLLVMADANVSHSAAAFTMKCCLFQDADVNAIAVKAVYGGASTGYVTVQLRKLLLAMIGAGVSTSFKVRAGASEGGTTTFNGTGGARAYGGVVNSFAQVQEIMG